MGKFHRMDHNSHVRFCKLYGQYKKGLSQNYVTYEPALRLGQTESLYKP